jgi:hypothetical protein
MGIRGENPFSNTVSYVNVNFNLLVEMKNYVLNVLKLELGGLGI